MKARTEALNAMRAEIRPGDVLAGKYRVERTLGQGGMGMVLAARHMQLDQPVAIKLLLPHSLRNPELVARFEQEARATVRIQSEHVIKVLDVGQDQGTPYMVMEFLQGQDLAAVLRARGPLPLADAVAYLLQACEALAEAHKLGIVHRDLKPANLFLTNRADGSPLVKVLDFGISKATLAAGGGHGLTMDLSVIGSPNYMSPEQLKNSRDVDARADIWSLGLVLYELLTGVVAFEADTLAELHVAILQSFPTSLLIKRPDLPPSLEMLLLKCLHKDRAFRYATVAELAQALAEFAPPSALVSVERVCRLFGAPPPTLPAAGPLSSSSWNAPPTASGWNPTPAPTAWGQQPPAPTWGSSFVPPPGSQVTSAPQPWQPAPLPGVAQPLAHAPASVPLWTAPPQQQQAVTRSGPPLALIILAVVVGSIVLGGAGCVACVLLTV